MEELKLSKKDIVEALNNGKKIRKTCGIWNNPVTKGKMVNTIEELDSFYNWACVVDVYKGLSEGVDYDLVGASSGDMF